MPVVVSHALNSSHSSSSSSSSRSSSNEAQFVYVYFDIHSFQSVLTLLMRNYEMGLCVVGCLVGWYYFFFPLLFACVEVFLFLYYLLLVIRPCALVINTLLHSFTRSLFHCSTESSTTEPRIEHSTLV